MMSQPFWHRVWTYLAKTRPSSREFVLFYGIVLIPFAIDAGIKHAMLNYMGGYSKVGLLLSRTNSVAGVSCDSTCFSLRERMSFYADDVWLMLILPPVIVQIAFWPLGRYRVWLFALLCGAVAAGLYVQRQVMWNTGAFLTFENLQIAVSWGHQHPEDFASYVRTKDIIRLVTLLAAPLLLVVLARVWPRRLRPPRLAGVACVLSITGLACALLVSQSLSFGKTRFHESVVVGSARTFFGYDDEVVDTSRFDDFGAEQLEAYYRTFVGSTPTSDDEYLGRARDCDVIFFICETAPARCLDICGDLSEFPALQRLAARSFLAGSHYATFPRTRNAVFSLYTSWYPSIERRYSKGYDEVCPSIFRSARGAGYETAAFLPFRLNAYEEPAYRAMGVHDVNYADQRRQLDVSTDEMGVLESRVSRDLEVVTALRGYITRQNTGNHRYVAAVLPQLGHAPFLDVIRDGKERSVIERGRAILALQDQWLGMIIDTLSRNGSLEKTLIVFVGDHGVRTRVEDPDLANGMISDYSFHVPCLVYAPMALAKTQIVSGVTSHVDIVPTIRRLLGFAPYGNDAIEFGLPLWSRSFETRTTFLLAADGLGCDGFFEKGRYYMVNRFDHYACWSDTFDFGGNAGHPLDAGGRQRVLDKLETFLAIQERACMLWTNSLKTKNNREK